MKVVDGALANIEVDAELRDLAKDLRYVATLIEKGEVNAVALAWTGDCKEGDKEYQDGVGTTWTCVNGNAHALVGALSQIQFELQMEIFQNPIDDEE